MSLSYSYTRETFVAARFIHVNETPIAIQYYSLQLSTTNHGLSDIDEPIHLGGASRKDELSYCALPCGGAANPLACTVRTRPWPMRSIRSPLAAT